MENSVPVRPLGVSEAEIDTRTVFGNPEFAGREVPLSYEKTKYIVFQSNIVSVFMFKDLINVYLFVQLLMAVFVITLPRV